MLKELKQNHMPNLQINHFIHWLNIRKKGIKKNTELRQLQGLQPEPVSLVITRWFDMLNNSNKYDGD